MKYPMNKIYTIMGRSTIHPYTLCLAACPSENKAKKLCADLEKVDKINLAFEAEMKKELPAYALNLAEDINLVLKMSAKQKSDYIKANYTVPSHLYEASLLLRDVDNGIVRLYSENEYYHEETPLLDV